MYTTISHDMSRSCCCLKLLTSINGVVETVFQSHFGPFSKSTICYSQFPTNLSFFQQSFYIAIKRALRPDSNRCCHCHDALKLFLLRRPWQIFAEKTTASVHPFSFLISYQTDTLVIVRVEWLALRPGSCHTHNEREGGVVCDGCGRKRK